MKTVNITFESDEHAQLTERKGGRSWRRYILELAGIPKNKDGE